MSKGLYASTTQTYTASIRELFETWLFQTSTALEFNQKELHLSAVPELSTVQTVDGPDDRPKKLAMGALEALPKPIQTLLKTLEEVKVDLKTYEIRQQQIANETVFVMITNLSHSLRESLQRIRTVQTELRQHVPNVFQHQGLFVEAHQLGLTTTGTSLEDLRCLYQEVLYKLFLEIQKRTSDRNVKHHNPVNAALTKKAFQYVEQSEALRNRLKALATGSLDRLYLQPIQEPEASGPKDDDTSLVYIERLQGPYEVESSLVTFLAKIRDAIRSTHEANLQTCKLYDSLLYESTVSFQMSIMNHVQTLRGLQVQCEDNQAYKDMIQADKAIQTELKFLLQTLTVDKASLDLFLRHIRKQVDIIEQTMMMEDLSKWNTSLKQWKAQIEGAFQEETILNGASKTNESGH